MLRSSISVLVLSILALAGGAPAAAQSCHSAEPEYPPEAQVNAARERRDAFDDAGENEWAGVYRFADSMTTVTQLAWSPASGLVVWREGCYPIPTNASYGSAELRDGRLVLAPEVPLGTRHSNGIAETFVAVRWGARHYLVPEDRLRELCFEVNAFGDEAPSFLLESDDREKPVRGRPDLPAGYEAFLLARPISARVVGAVEGTEREVVLDRGSAHGLLEGMWLGGERRGGSVEVRVISVEERSACAEIGGYSSSGEFGGKPGEIVGWRLSTRYTSPWR